MEWPHHREAVGSQSPRGGREEACPVVAQDAHAEGAGDSRGRDRHPHLGGCQWRVAEGDVARDHVGRLAPQPQRRWVRQQVVDQRWGDCTDSEDAADLVGAAHVPDRTSTVLQAGFRRWSGSRTIS